MQRKVKIVALNIHKYDLGLDQYVYSLAIDKIDFIVNRIKEICEELSIAEAESQESAIWIIATNEYAISNGNTKFISPACVKYLKEALSEVARQYPQLIIIPGTLSKLKHYANFKFLDKKTNQERDIKKEVRDAYTVCMQKDNIRNIEEHYKQAENFLQSASGGAVVKNKTYVITSEGIFSRFKAIPYYELNMELNEKGDLLLPNAVFMPGSNRDEDRIMTIGFKDGSCIRFVLDICVELERRIELHAITGPVDFHFVLSNSIPVNFLNIIAKYFVQFDFIYKPYLLKTADIDSQFDVELYQDNLLTPNMYLRGPLQVIYPNELRIINLLMQAASASSSQKENHEITRWQKLFTKNIRTVANRTNTLLLSELWNACYTYYQAAIKDYMKRNPGKKTIYQTEFIISAKLYTKIKNEILSRPDYMLISKQDFKLLADSEEEVNPNANSLSLAIYMDKLVLSRVELEQAIGEFNIAISLEKLIKTLMDANETRLFLLVNRIRLLIHDNHMHIFDHTHLKQDEVLLAAIVIHALIARRTFQVGHIPVKDKNWLLIAKRLVGVKGLPQDIENALQNYIKLNDPKSSYSILLPAMNATNASSKINDNNRTIAQPTVLMPAQKVSTSSVPSIQPLSVSGSHKLGVIPSISRRTQ